MQLYQKDAIDIIDDYIYQTDWRVKESSSSIYGYGGLCKHIVSEPSKYYWLNKVYNKDITNAYYDGRMHIHDLGGLTLYCCGYSLSSILNKGVTNIPNIPESSPAKHFDSALNQIANLITVFQNEICGAVALNSFDTLLAPYIKIDKLTYDQVYQNIQNFVYSINSNSRMGAEPAFSNVTFDITPPNDLINEHVIVANKATGYSYFDCQKEMDILNKAFCNVMLNGDAKGRPFSYPVCTYNIHERFNWDNVNNNLIFKMAGKYGYPYFANFLNSDMNPEDIRSMCCRISLNLKELRKRNGGLFGSGDSTGSIGVVTINLPQLGYKCQNEEEFFNELDDILYIARDSLEMKRNFINEVIIEKGMLHAFSEYVGTTNNHFSTIGIVGLNEMCENYFGAGIDILSDVGKKFSEKVCNHIRDKLIKFQEQTGNLYNFEATPAESTCYRLASIDIKKYPSIITRGTKESPYYTNSCHIPVNKVESIKQLFDHQDDLQVLFTGGTVIHIFTNLSISAEKAKQIVKTVCENYKAPYISISPLNRYCSDHGHIDTLGNTCPVCYAPLEMYQRVTGYLRRVDFFNTGKKAEFEDRNQLNL